MARCPHEKQKACPHGGTTGLHIRSRHTAHSHAPALMPAPIHYSHQILKRHSSGFEMCDIKIALLRMFLENVHVKEELLRNSC